MLRDDAVIRIQDQLDGLGSSRLASKIILRLQEAQRELEMGKTLPKFLLQEEFALTLSAGDALVALPERFLRIDDSFPPYYTSVSNTDPTFLTIKRDLGDVLVTQPRGTGAPRLLVIKRGFFDFVDRADVQYSVLINYYKGAEILFTNIENDWLAHGTEWLIGEAGYRIAKDARDGDAVKYFDDMRKQGRLAVFGEIVAEEEADGPILMGANL